MMKTATTTRYWLADDSAMPVRIAPNVTAETLKGAGKRGHFIDVASTSATPRHAVMIGNSVRRPDEATAMVAKALALSSRGARRRAVSNTMAGVSNGVGV